MNRIAAFSVCLLVSFTPIPSDPQYETGLVDARIVLGPNEDGELLISIKVEVRNNTDDELAVDLSIQGCDREGFELAEFELEGNIPANARKTITDTDYVDAEIFEAISNWIVEE